MSCAQLPRLLHHDHTRICAFNCFSNVAALVPDDGSNPSIGKAGSGIENIAYHRRPCDRMEDLRTIGAHPGPLAGGQDDYSETRTWRFGLVGLTHATARRRSSDALTRRLASQDSNLG